MSKQPRRPVRFLVLLGLAAAIVLAILYARCGLGGLGLGGGEGDRKGKGKPDTPTQTLVGGDAGSGPAASPPCKLRLDGAGITVDGKPASVAAAVDSCKQAGGADLTITGDALTGVRQDLRDQLRAADIPVLER